MSLCQDCSNINLETEISWYINDSKSMVKSAKAGCPCCKFFLDCGTHELNFNDSWKDYRKWAYGISVNRNTLEDNKVYLKYVFKDEDEEDGEVDEGAPVMLRLCDTYAWEMAPKAEYEESDGPHPGRLIALNSGDEECLNLAEEWLERCSRLHGTYCHDIHQDVILPTRLIHIPKDPEQQLQLRVTKGQMGRYVALSYCWGLGLTFMTTRTTMESMMTGFDMEQLPKTLREAVIVCRRLGFEYVWIDCLCIIQNDSEDWASEASKMADVYGNATLTVCADLAYHSDEGLFRDRERNLRSPPFGTDGRYTLQTMGEGWEFVPREPLGQRGWTLQERMLSQRMLHFLSEELAWECRTCVYLEDSHGYQRHLYGHFAVGEMSASLPSAKVHYDLNLETQLDSFHRGVMEQAPRSFTVETDRLNALTGLVEAIRIEPLGRYLAGVWENQVFSCLGWFTSYDQTPYPGYRAPSWSWASMNWQLISRSLWWLPSWPIRDEHDEEWNAWAEWWHPDFLGDGLKWDSVEGKGNVLEGSWIMVEGWCRSVWVREEGRGGLKADYPFVHWMDTSETDTPEARKELFDEEGPQRMVVLDRRVGVLNKVFWREGLGDDMSMVEWLLEMDEVHEIYEEDESEWVSEDGSSVGSEEADADEAEQDEEVEKTTGTPTESEVDSDDDSDDESDDDSEESVDLNEREGMVQMREFLVLQICRERGRTYPKVVSLVLERATEEGGDEEDVPRWRRMGLMVSDDPDAGDEEWRGKWEKRKLKLV